MIVKIKHKNSWVFYDELSRINYKKVSIVDILKTKNDVEWINEESGSLDSVVMFTRKTNGEEFIIFANEGVYLLNNEGKTIERIN